MANKIVIIEDDPLMSRMYSKVFLYEGYTVITAGDGEEGLAKVQTEKPAIILLDVMMPKMNGFQVLEKLQADPELKDIPVIMLTNLAGEGDAKAALSKGAFKYVVKSEHEPKEIVSIIKEVLAKYAANSTPTA